MQSPFFRYLLTRNTHSAALYVVVPDFPHQQVHNQQRPIKLNPPQTAQRTTRLDGGGGEGGGGIICREYSEGGNKASFTLTIENHDGCDVSASIAVIWCTPDGNEVLIEMVLVPFHDKLMSACNQR